MRAARSRMPTSPRAAGWRWRHAFAVIVHAEPEVLCAVLQLHHDALGFGVLEGAAPPSRAISQCPRPRRYAAQAQPLTASSNALPG
jgi:hypothetical protein